MSNKPKDKLDGWQRNSSGKNSKKISEQAKSFIDVQQVKSKNRWVASEKQKWISNKWKAKINDWQVKIGEWQTKTAAAKNGWTKWYSVQLWSQRWMNKIMKSEEKANKFLQKFQILGLKF